MPAPQYAIFPLGTAGYADGCASIAGSEHKDETRFRNEGNIARAAGRQRGVPQAVRVFVGANYSQRQRCDAAAE